MTPQDIESIFNIGNAVPVPAEVQQSVPNNNVYYDNSGGQGTGTGTQSAFSSAFELGGSSQ